MIQVDPAVWAWWDEPQRYHSTIGFTLEAASDASDLYGRFRQSWEDVQDMLATYDHFSDKGELIYPPEFVTNVIDSRPEVDLLKLQQHELAPMLRFFVKAADARGLAVGTLRLSPFYRHLQEHVLRGHYLDM